MRTCFYPILGDLIYGLIGDMIDTLCIICTLFGVCTSLGLGVMQLNNGIHRINSDIGENTDNQIIIIWCVTALATISVISGLKVGIRRLSEICFGIGKSIFNTKQNKQTFADEFKLKSYRTLKIMFNIGCLNLARNNALESQYLSTTL